jgi:transcriptional antiterminator RfaH
MRWYVVATKPNCENKAFCNLQRQQFESYFPRILVRRSHARRVQMVRRPLFSGYLFVRLNPETPRWRSINGTIGVKQILTSNGLPQPLYDGFVDALRKLETNGVVFVPPAHYEIGEAVQVQDGPFASQIGTMLSADKSGRVRLLMELLGGEVVTTVSRDMIRKVG